MNDFKMRLRPSVFFVWHQKKEKKIVSNSTIWIRSSYSSFISETKFDLLECLGFIHNSEADKSPNIETKDSPNAYFFLPLFPRLKCVLFS